MKNTIKFFGPQRQRLYSALCAVVLTACFILGCPNPTPSIVKSDLKAALDAAEAAKAGVSVSADGSDVPVTVYWVTQNQMETFTTAISSAQAVYDNANVNQSTVDSAKTVLDTATSTFNEQKKAGSKTEVEPALTGIAITTPPTKIIYDIGNTLNLTGLVVTATYSDNSTAVIGTNILAVSGFDSSTEGDKTITVTYKGKSADFTVTVLPPAFTAFEDWLSAQPANTAATAYTYALNVNDLDGNYNTPGSLGYILKANSTKYVNLDLSGSTITTIGEKAFYNCTSLTGVTIPNSVISIGYDAFADCTSLTSVTIPNSVISIGTCAFLYCGNITGITIPDSVTSVEEGAFYGCTSLASVVIGNGVTSLNGFYFHQNNKLTSVTIGNSVTSIEERAFDGCNNLNITWYYNPALTAENFSNYLKNVTIGNNVTNIGKKAFYNCSGLTGVTIPNSVTSIGDFAFLDSGLTSVTIGNSVTSIGEGAFYNCSGLTGVTIPNSVTSIGDFAFLGSGLTRVTIGNSVTSIGEGAFAGTSLTSVTIPKSVTSIGGSAFNNCNELTSVTIGNGVTSIGRSTFEGCTSLTSVTIPKSVTSIGRSTFEGCTSLTSVTFQGTIASSNLSSDNSFPGDLRDKYLAADGGIGTYTRTSDEDTWTKQ